MLSFERDCEDCGGRIEVRQLDAAQERWRVYQPDGSQVEHLAVCTTPDARAWRIRRGLEPGRYPVSPTAIQTYIDCPFAYLLEHFERLTNLGLVSRAVRERVLRLFPDGRPVLPQNPNGLLGDYGHRYIAARMLDQEPPLYDGPLELFDEWSRMRYAFEVQMDDGWWLKKGAGIEEWLLWEYQDPENGWVVEVAVILDYWRTTRSDIVRAIVTDWKLGRAVNQDPDLLQWIREPDVFMISSQARLRKSMQAALNLLVLSHHIDFEEGIFGEWHGRFGGALVSAPFDLRRLQDFEEALVSQVRRMIADREFNPNPYCEVCPAGFHPTSHPAIGLLEERNGELVVPRRPTTYEEAEVLAMTLHDLDRIRKAIRDPLYDWCADEGPVGPWGHWEHKRKRLVKYRTRRRRTRGKEMATVPAVEDLIKLLRDIGQPALIAELVVASGEQLSRIVNAKRSAVNLRIRGLLEEGGFLEEEVETKFEERKGWRLAPPSAPPRQTGDDRGLRATG